MSGNPFKPAKSGMKIRRGKSARQMAKDATAAMVRRTAVPGLRGYVLALPPLSLNNVYNNRGDGGRGIGAKYKDWIAQAGWEIKLQQPTPVAGPFCCLIEVGAKRSKADLDNLAKPLIDLMVTMGCVPDDRNLVELTMRRTDRADVAITVWTQGWVPTTREEMGLPSLDELAATISSHPLPTDEPASICAAGDEITGAPV